METQRLTPNKPQWHVIAIQKVFVLMILTQNTCALFIEGLAVGVGFGAIGKTPSATFESAR